MQQICIQGVSYMEKGVRGLETKMFMSGSGVIMNRGVSRFGGATLLFLLEDR